MNQRKKGNNDLIVLWKINERFKNTRDNQQELSDEKSLEFKHFKTSLRKIQCVSYPMLCIFGSK